ncbi:MAG: hypothetical protein CTY20_07865 [Hyphomicrobium sp.]|nr:MAG: hypothetical protein CTY20_07865 [Hyphomicrobium sp.]
MTPEEQHEAERTYAAITVATARLLMSGCHCSITSIAQKARVSGAAVDKHYRSLVIALVDEHGDEGGDVYPVHPVYRADETLRLQAAVAEAWVALRLVPATPELQQVREKLNALAAITHFPPGFDTKKWAAEWP